eukprot:GHRR01002751.1.p1 GENE.GHRR01002751.1~~GHRR01002751.1.p1  ORF type:complete len:362 (+),score=81.76 GHRR01002751.1:61-1146(+)
MQRCKALMFRAVLHCTMQILSTLSRPQPTNAMATDHDLMAIGHHCSVSDCQQLDFLPFKCDCCNQTFCLAHRTYAAHACKLAGNKQLEIIVCPICAKGVRLAAGEEPDLVFERHTRTDCDPSNYAKVHKKPKCPVPGCKEKLTTINTYTCKSCKQTVCLRHRLQGDHNCAGQPATAGQRLQATASAAASAAAAAHSLGSKASSLLSGMLRHSTGTASASSSSTIRSRGRQQQAGAQYDETNTVHGSADRRRQMLGLTPTAARGTIAAGLEVCPQCGCKFASLQELIQHAETSHSSSSRQATTDQQCSQQQTRQQSNGVAAGSGEVFACPRCNAQFSDAVLLVAHSEQCGSSAAQQPTCVLC